MIIYTQRKLFLIILSNGNEYDRNYDIPFYYEPNEIPRTIKIYDYLYIYALLIHIIHGNILIILKHILIILLYNIHIYI